MRTIDICWECGHNGNGNMRLNKLMIDEIKSFGGKIAKFQLYSTDKIKKPWQSRYMELKMAELTKEDAWELKKHCDEIVSIVREERGKKSLLEDENLNVVIESLPDRG